jgi:hypothetical protein
MGFDFIPDAEFCFWGPDGHHVGARIAWDHRNCLFAGVLAEGVINCA